MKGALQIHGHLIELQTWADMGGGWEDLVAWCHTCDHQGERVMKIDLYAHGGPTVDAAKELMNMVVEHCFATETP